MGACSVTIRVGTEDVPAVMQPDTHNWTPPNQFGNDGEGAPILAPYWKCQLGFSKLTTIQYQQWFSLLDGDLHYIGLPSPIDGSITDYECYVESISPRISTQGGTIAMAGIDVTLSHIYVGIPDA